MSSRKPSLPKREQRGPHFPPERTAFYAEHGENVLTSNSLGLNFYLLQVPWENEKQIRSRLGALRHTFYVLS